jgi:hypothetical protein
MSAASWNGFVVMRIAPQRALLSAWQANCNRGSMWFLGLMGLLLASLPITVWWFTHERDPQFTILAAAAVMGIATVAAWAMLAFNLLLQNHPHSARLLPAQVPVLRTTLWATGALLCALATLLGWLAGGPVLATAAGTALVLGWSVLCLRWAWLWLAFPLLCVSLPLLHLESEISMWHTAPQAFTLMALVLAALAVRAVVMTGDAGHVRAHARLRSVSAAMQGQEPGTSAQPSGATGWAWILKLSNSVYAVWLDRVIVRAKPDVGVRLAMGLGPQVHWTGVVAGQSIAVTLGVLMLVVVQLFPNWGTGRSMVSGLMAGIVFGGITVSLAQLPAGLWASRREQSLLRLLPGAPQGTQLNRWLALRMAGIHLAVLVLQGLLLAVMGVFASGHVFGGKAVALALSALLLSTPLVFTLWRDWANAKAPTGGAPVSTLLASFAIFGAATTWINWLDFSRYALAALTLLVMLPLGWWRWRVIARAPIAWPVGRLG